MKQRVLPLLLAAVICLGVLCPVCAGAVTPLDPEADASLTLRYQKGGTVFPELEVGIYRIARAFPDGSFQLIEPFSSYPVNIRDIQQQERWTDIAQTLHSYIIANRVKPDREKPTDETGVVCFEGLETGLYYVREAVAENADGTYLFNRFLVYVPTPDADGSYDYHVEAVPKCTEFVPKTRYTVTKLWQDAGHQAERPTAVTVDIYRDGVLQESQLLNAENQWSYTWFVSGETGIWTVAERSVPKPYKVTVQENGSVFSIINTWKSTPQTPQTGDMFSPLPWILALCASGIGLLILGVYIRRRK